MPAPVHRTTARKFLAGVGTIIVLGVIAFIGVKANSGGEIPLQKYTYVKAQFVQAGTLNEKQDVRQNSLRIGQITDITYQNGVAEATLRIDGDYPVFADASAKVSDESPLSKKYVDFTPGTPQAGPLQGPIKPQSTRSSVALDDLFDVFDPATRTGLQTTLRELSTGTAGHSEDLQDILTTATPLLGDLGTVTRAAASREADLPSLLRNADRLVGRFQAHQGEIRGLLRNLDPTLQAVAVDGTKPLRATLQKAPATVASLRTTLDNLNGPLSDAHSALDDLGPGAKALGDATPDLRGVLREAVPPLEKVPDVADQAEPAVEDLTQVASDLRPLVPKVARTLKLANPLLKDLAPYACQIGGFFANNDLLSGRIAPNQHYFSAQPVFPGPYNASLPINTTRINNYPAPDYCKGVKK